MNKRITKRMKQLLMIVCFGLMSQMMNAQNVQWAGTIGNAGYCGANATITDAAGNMFTTGYFSGTVDFNTGAGINNLVSAGSYDAYLLKMDASGNFVWAAKMGLAQDDRGLELTIDNAGNILVTGYQSGLFNLGLGVPNINIWKFNSAGTLLWSKTIGGNYADYGNSICTDLSNNVYVVGTFSNVVDFNPGGANLMTLSSTGNQTDMFIMKLLANGNVAWAKKIAGASTTTVVEKAIKVQFNQADNEICYAGHFGGSVDFNLSLAAADTFFLNTTNNSVRHIFFSRVDTSGSFINAVMIGNQTEILLGDFTYNSTFDQIFITGGFRSVVDFNPALGGTFNLDAGTNVGTAVFELQLDNFLNFSSAFKLNSQTQNTNSVGLSIDVDGNDNLYIGGRLEGLVDLNPNAGLLNIKNYTSIDQMDMFLIKLTNSGAFVYGDGFGATNNELVKDLSVTDNNDIYMVGSFDTVVNFAFYGPTASLSPNGLGSSYLVKYATNSIPLPLTWQSFTAELNDNNTTDLTWTTSSEKNTLIFEVEKSTDAKTWTVINQQMAAGNSETEKTYKAIDNKVAFGTTYYRIKQTDMDNKYTYSTIQKVNRINHSDVSIYPNPVMNTLNISLNNATENTLIEIYSLEGKKLMTAKTNDLNHSINVETLAKGTYMIRISNTEKTYTSKFVRQ